MYIENIKALKQKVMNAFALFEARVLFIFVLSPKIGQGHTRRLTAMD